MSPSSQENHRVDLDPHEAPNRMVLNQDQNRQFWNHLRDRPVVGGGGGGRGYNKTLTVFLKI